uniref:F-box domain-containing protein n=1 Tax=Moniliophthora roreri TaxID=221103 RepID=A0A0W0FLM7_MONRR
MSQDQVSDLLAQSTKLCNRCDAEFTPRALYPPIATDVLRTNYNPERTLVDTTRGFLHDEEQELALYDEEIARLQQVLESLQSKRRALSQRYRDRRSFISPMRRLPTELFLSIFENVCLPKRTNHHSLYIGDSIWIPAIALSQVCSQWRDVIHNIPRLWSSISLDISSGPTYTRNIARLIQLYLRNSKGCPLRVSINGVIMEPYPKSLWDGHNLTALKSLMQQASRCEVLQLRLHTLDLAAIGPMAISFPHLRELRNFIRVPEDAPDNNSWFWNALRNAPQLANLAMRTIPGQSLNVLPFNQISSLTISWVTSIPPLLEMLSTLTNITSVSVHALDRGMSASTPVTLPNIGTLRLGPSSERLGTFAPLLDSLILPSLTTFESTCTYATTLPHNFPSLPALFQRSSCPLRNLTLQYPTLYLSEKVLIETLKAVPSLTHIELCVRGDEQQTRESTYQMIHHLAVRSEPDDTTEPIMLPNLTSVRLMLFNDRDLPVPHDTAECIIDMVDSRNQGNPGCTFLDTVYVCFRYLLQSSIVINLFKEGALADRVQNLQERGTRVGFEYISTEECSHRKVPVPRMWTWS